MSQGSGLYVEEKQKLETAAKQLEEQMKQNSEFLRDRVLLHLDSIFDSLNSLRSYPRLQQTFADMKNAVKTIFSRHDQMQQQIQQLQTALKEDMLKFQATKPKEDVQGETLMKALNLNSQGIVESNNQLERIIERIIDIQKDIQVEPLQEPLVSLLSAIQTHKDMIGKTRDLVDKLLQFDVDVPLDEIQNRHRALVRSVEEMLDELRSLDPSQIKVDVAYIACVLAHLLQWMGLTQYDTLSTPVPYHPSEECKSMMAEVSPDVKDILPEGTILTRTSIFRVIGNVLQKGTRILGAMKNKQIYWVEEEAHGS